jgi:hypothetical protein
MENLKTVFQYLDRTELGNRECARAIAGHKLQTDPYAPQGGYSPTINSLDPADAAFVSAMAQRLFSTYSKKERPNQVMERKIKELLLATVLLRLDDFLNVLYDHPNQEFGMRGESDSSGELLVTRHLFINSLLKCARDEARNAKWNRSDDMSLATLLGWHKAIKRQFTLENAMHVSCDDVRSVTGDAPFLFDTRSITDHLAQQTQLYNQMVRMMTDSSSRQEERMRAMEDENRQLTRYIVTLTQLICQSTGRNFHDVMVMAGMSGVGHHFLQVGGGDSASAPGHTLDGSDDHTAALQVAEDGFIPSAIPISAAKLTIKQTFYNYFKYAWFKDLDVPRVYKDRTESNNANSTKTTIKRIVQYLYNHAPEHVPMLPEGCFGGDDASELGKQWREILRYIANAACQSACSVLNAQTTETTSKKKKFDGNTLISAFKTAYYNLDCTFWPEGPEPGPQYEFFQMCTRDVLVQMTAAEKVKQAARKVKVAAAGTATGRKRKQPPSANPVAAAAAAEAASATTGTEISDIVDI